MMYPTSNTHESVPCSQTNTYYTSVLWVLWYAPQEESSKNSTVADFCVKRYLIGARYYDGDLGLWTSVDAMREFWTPYNYVGNNPVNMYNPDGRQSAKIIEGGKKVGEHLKKQNQASNMIVDDANSLEEYQRLLEESNKNLAGGARNFGEATVELIDNCKTGPSSCAKKTGKNIVVETGIWDSAVQWVLSIFKSEEQPTQTVNPDDYDWIGNADDILNGGTGPYEDKEAEN